MFEHNVIAVSFEDRSNAYQALSELKGAGLEGRVEVLSASIVTRDAQGRLDAPEGGDTVGGVVADTIAHASERGGATRRSTMRRILGASIRALEITVVPAVLLLLSDTGIWSLRTGLILAIAALTVTQLVLVLLGLRGSATTKGQKAGYLLLQLAAVGGVVLLKVVVH